MARITGVRSVAKAQRNTFGATVGRIAKAGLLDAELEKHLRALLKERNWLVHKSRCESRNAVRVDAAARKLVDRVDAMAEESNAILKCIGELAEQHVLSRGVSSGRIDEIAARLYTCWHVATGIELHPLSVPHRPPSRRYLRITLQGFRPAIADDGETRVGNIIGGVQQADLALYSEDSDDAISIWYQDPQYQKNGDLEAVGIRVPKSFDLIKLPVPDDIEVSDVQVVAEDTLLTTFPVIGDEVLIVGYPYGYSTHGLDQPTPVVLSRRVAAVMSPERPSDILLDGGAARGMSGGPVFLRDDNGLTLLGVYTGLVYADYQRQQRELHTALGSACHGLFGMTPGTPTSLVRADTLF